MGRTLMGTLRTGSLFGVRGKCRYDNHESVTLVGGQWKGESSGSFYCDLAPTDQCTTCAGRGFHEVRGAMVEHLESDGHPTEVIGGVKVARKPCPPCKGSGYVSGPHHPWRHEHPGPVRNGE